QPPLSVVYFYAGVNYVNTAARGHQRPDNADTLGIPRTILQARRKRTLVEIVVRIAHVGVFRLVTDLRRKFGVAGMDVWHLRRQNGVIASPPDWKRKCQNFNKTSHMACACAPKSAPYAI